MRLTEKRNGVYNKDNVLSNGIPRLDLKEWKLSQLEDIEDELGIDLVTLFKALKNGIYYGYDKDDICHYKELELKYWKYWYLYVDGIGQVYFEDYGKTWALTKEVLD